MQIKQIHLTLSYELNKWIAVFSNNTMSTIWFQRENLTFRPNSKFLLYNSRKHPKF